MRKFPVLLLIVIALLSACSSKEFDKEVKSATVAIEDKNFEAASIHLSKAKELKPKETEITELLDIVQTIIDSQSAMEKGEFEAAIFLVEKALKYDSNKMNKLALNFADTLKSELERLKQQTAQLNNTLSTAKVLMEQKKYDEAIAILQSVDISESEYMAITKLQNDVKMLKLEVEKNKEIAIAQQKLEEEKKAAEAARIAEEQAKKLEEENRLKAYNGNWGDSNFYSNGGRGIMLNFTNANTANVTIESVSSPPANRIASFDVKGTFSKDGTASFTFDDDGWFSKGNGTIKLKDNKVIVSINITESAGENWNIFSGTVTFTRDKSY